MLKQILRDMYIDPEILAGLDETQKQTLFCKMREEQIRRWRLWDKQEPLPETKVKRRNSYGPRKVTFRNGEDGEPWVWIMGEHEDDLTIDEILISEAKLRARQLAEIETKELRKSYEVELAEIIDYTDIRKLNETDDIESNAIEEIYCSVDELRERSNNSKTSSVNNTNTNTNGNNNTNNITNKQKSDNYNNNNRLVNFNNLSSVTSNRNEVLKEISNNKSSQKVSTRIAQWEKKVIGEKTNEIYRRIQKKQQETCKEAEAAAEKQEQLWKEQERKSKQAEIQIRDIARRAREEYRKSLTAEQINDNNNNNILHVINNNNQQNSNSSSPPSSLESSISLRPSNQDAVIQWFRDIEFNRNKYSLLDKSNEQPFKWFHGLISRQEAENRLDNEEIGTFLIRISEKIWGYAISYKDLDKCKHYLVDASTGKYKFLGENQLTHNTLNELIEYHGKEPITIIGNELLCEPCSTTECPEILNGLL